MFDKKQVVAEEAQNSTAIEVLDNGYHNHRNRMRRTVSNSLVFKVVDFLRKHKDYEFTAKEIAEELSAETGKEVTSTTIQTYLWHNGNSRSPYIYRAKDEGDSCYYYGYLDKK